MVFCHILRYTVIDSAARQLHRYRRKVLQLPHQCHARRTDDRRDNLDRHQARQHPYQRRYRRQRKYFYDIRLREAPEQCTYLPCQWFHLFSNPTMVSTSASIIVGPIGRLNSCSAICSVIGSVRVFHPL